MKKAVSYVILLLLVIATTKSKAQEGWVSTVGKAATELTNRKSIDHPLNESTKNRLIKEAILNAIDSAKNITVRILSKTSLHEFNNRLEHTDEFTFSTVQNQNVLWKRTSSAKFTQNGRHVECVIYGLVKNVDGPAVSPTDPGLEFLPAKFFITRKDYNIAHTSLFKNIEPGQKLVVTREVKTRALGKYDVYDKVKALLYVKRVEADFSVVRIVKGVFRVKEGDEVKIKEYKTHRTGFTVAYGSLQNKPEVNAFSLSFYTYSYRSKIGLNLGGDVLYSSTTSQTSNASNSLDLNQSLFYVHSLGVFYDIGLIPDVLFVEPALNTGLLVAIAPSVMINPKLQLGLRLGFLEILGGASYRSFSNDQNNLGGLYLNGALRVNLNKMMK